jgi:hypothetical protein
MRRLLIILSFYLAFNAIKSQVSAQSFGTDNTDNPSISNEDLQLLYSPDSNHREIVLKSFELAVAAGFADTSGITIQEIKDRLEAGAYSEDFEEIPGIVGEHFPAPWNQGPDFIFYGLYPFSKIPYGSYTDTLSGWYRGLNHGYDPVQNFIWPGAYATTVDWANSPVNSFIWDNVINLYSSGDEAKAYECLGHLLHLLADLSVPSHVKVVDHGIGINSINAGTPLDPDLLDLIVDEYELSLAGGIPLPGVIFIPNLLNDFQSALNLSNVNNIPVLGNWENYFVELGQYTYNHSIVNQYYEAPVQNGEWGAALNENGTPTNPTQYGITPPVQLNGRWVQVTFKSTAGPNGTIIPESKMLEMCNALVPKAVEYSAGLLMYFNSLITNVIDNQIPLEDFSLYQNYPNPFNPSTKISWQVPVGSHQTLKIYDVLGNEVTTLVDEYKPAGKYEVEWNASKYPSGVYFYQLKTQGFVETKKMILIK